MNVNNSFVFPYFPRKFTEINSCDVNCVCLKSKFLSKNLEILQLALKLFSSVQYLTINQFLSFPSSPFVNLNLLATFFK